VAIIAGLGIDEKVEAFGGLLSPNAFSIAIKCGSINRLPGLRTGFT
jgi:hypothetical protein